MNDRRKALLLSAFAADSLALGAHWIYDADRIAAHFGRVSNLEAPLPDSYHPTKKKGDFTHYGDQMLILLASIADRGGFDLADFSRKWRNLFADYSGYIDGATRKTLAYYEKGRPPEQAGSHTSDFAGAARIAPVILRYAGDPDAMAEAARAQTAMTHNDPATLDTAAFFARTAHAVLQGASPVQAMSALAETEEFEMSPVSIWVADGLKSAGEDTREVIERFGQACETKQVFPGVVHLIARYESDLAEALIQAVMAGGDSAARGMMAGTILGAHLGLSALPAQWVDGLNAGDRIRRLLDSLA